MSGNAGESENTFSSMPRTNTCSVQRAMEDQTPQRRFERYDVGLEAQCITAGNIMSKKCWVTEISRVGASMHLLVNEKLRVGQSVMLQILVPGKFAPINAVIRLTWFKRLGADKEYNFTTGGKITFIKAEDRDALLSYAYRRLIELEKAG
jgi:hypothetical protein